MVTGGNEEGEEKPGASLTHSVKEVIKDVEQIEERRRKDDEKLEKVRWKLYKIEKKLQDREGPAPRRRRRRASTTPEGPAPTVEDFQMKAAGNGRAVAIFDNAKQVTLSRTLKELTAILAADEGESPDDLVAWKSFDRLGELLEKRLGRKFAHHALSQILWRLRELIEAAGIGRSLIESVPALGARLRLKGRRSAALRVG